MMQIITFDHGDYRVKPETKYVPYDSIEEVEKDKWLRNKMNGRLSRIVSIDTNDVLCIRIDFKWVTKRELLEDYTYEDGTPCGKQVEE